jgi:acid phosphatase
MPRWDHVVVVVLENQSADQVRALPYLSSLRAAGRELTALYAVARPSQPNYIALFSGGTQGVADNNSHDLTGENLSTRLAASGYRMVSWAQSLPTRGFRGDAYPYLRKHNPAASFSTVPDDTIRPFSELPADFSTLPAVSFIIPDMVHDMHDDSPAHSDAWLGTVLPGYVAWAVTHRSLLIVTFDEPDTGLGADVTLAPILTILVGDGVRPSVSAQRLSLYSLLKYLLDSFGLPPLGLDAGEPVLDDGR